MADVGIKLDRCNGNGQNVCGNPKQRNWLKSYEILPQVWEDP